MNFKPASALLIMTLLFFNCSSSSDSEETKQEMEQEKEQEPNPTALTYDADIKSIFSGNCTQCHGSPTSQGAPTSYVTYNQVKVGINNIISRINSTSISMPPSGRMSSDLRAKIQQWKDDGLLEK